jgi:MFS transporter, DHA3 family, macrolide efflux protein
MLPPRRAMLRFRRAESSLGVRYWRLCTALGISRLGDALSGMTLLLWIYARSGHDPLVVGALVGAEFLAPLLVSPIAGRFIDRWSRVPLMVGANVTSAALGIALLISVLSGYILPAIGLVGAMSAFGSASEAAEVAFLPSIVAAHQLGRANSYSNSVNQATFILGPGLAAILYELTGPAWSLAFDIASFAFSAVLLLRLGGVTAAAEPERTDSCHGRRGTGRPVSRIALASPLLRYVVLAMAVMTVSAGVSNTIGIVFIHVDLHVNPAFISLFAATNGVCQLAVSIVLPRFADRFRPQRLIGPAMAVMACGAWIYATSNLLGIALLGVAVTAIANAPFNVGIISITQTAVPNFMRGRFGLIVNAVSNVMFFVGSQGGAVLSDFGNPRLVFLISASLMTLAAGSALLPRLSSTTALVPSASEVFLDG